MIFDDRRCELGEGPLWHPTRNQLFWFDILGQKLLSQDRDGPREWRFPEIASAAGWVSDDAVSYTHLMRIGADRLYLGPHRDQAVRGAGELAAQPFLHRLHRPILPQKAVPAPGAKIGDLQTLDVAQAGDLFPQLGHGAGVQHLQFELPLAFQHRATAQFLSLIHI